MVSALENQMQNDEEEEGESAAGHPSEASNAIEFIG
jgi:hypothetical protein